MINKLRSLKGKTKVKFDQYLGKYDDEMSIRWQSGTFQFEEDPFNKIVQGLGNVYHEILLLIKFLQTKPQIKSMNINYFDLYYTVIKNRDDKEFVNDENDYISFNAFITPNQHIGRKNDSEILKWRKLRSAINQFK